jgi:predicted RecA/RadA family phage recombinase
MAEATFSHEGKTIDHTPSGALAAGDVVDLGTSVGIAVTAIAANTQGALTIEGVFDFAKFVDEVIAVWDVMYWDEATNTASKTIAYSEAVIGKAVKAAAAGDATVRIKLLPALG